MQYIFDPSNWDVSDPKSIPVLFYNHLYITVVCVALGFVIAFPIALLVTRYRRAYLPVVTVAGILYTLPSFAVLALLVPVTGLEVTTVLIPLVVYAQVVLIRNIVAGIRAVDPALVEVGRAMGMNTAQIQRKVVLPLALPVIVAGVRVVAVTNIGIASVAPLVGVRDLGTLIFDGFSYSYPDEIIGGAILITLLAVGADLLLLLVQRLLARGQSVSPAM